MLHAHAASSHPRAPGFADFPLQAALAVGSPNDPLEVEADRAAEQVMRAPGSAAGAPPPVVGSGAETLRRMCAECEEEAALQRMATGDPTAEVGALDQARNALRSPGRPLDTGTRAFMEQRFGHDFARVRIHAGPEASRSADMLAARAYTVGSDIAFGQTGYAPGSTADRKLLAHELAHVIQQGAARPLGTHGDASIPTAGAGPRIQKKPKTDAAQSRTTPTAGAQAALKAAKKLAAQTSPAIWFDSWGNDLRDNDLDGKIDEKSERHFADGAHYHGTHHAKVCKNASDRTDSCPAKDQSTIKVAYKVCIDIPIESYKAAGVPISSSRWIPSFFAHLKGMSNWRVWEKGARPPSLLDGDIVAASNAKHQHSGIVETGLFDSVINLPGPTAARKYGVFRPSGLNDMVTVPRILFESFLGIDYIARPIK